MAGDPSVVKDGSRFWKEEVVVILDRLPKNNLWKRILKNTIATTLMVSIVLIPGSRHVLGTAGYLGAITTVFGHPGRRFGQMAEQLALAVTGALVGVAWSTLGLYLGSLVIHHNAPAAYSIRALFLLVVVMIHGYLRSMSPRLFTGLLLLVLVSVVELTSMAKSATKTEVTSVLYPILVAAGIIPFVNILVFPEFSSGFLGHTTIEALSETAAVLDHAGSYFVGHKDMSAADGKQSQIPKGAAINDAQHEAHESPQKDACQDHRQPRNGISGFMASCKTLLASMKDNGQAESTSWTIEDLITSKTTIRQKLGICKAAQQESNFELAVSVLPPREMKGISGRPLKRLVANTISVIGACESKFALVGEEAQSQKSHSRSDAVATPSSNQERQHSKSHGQGEVKNEAEKLTVELEKQDLEAIKPKREIEFGDARLLRYLIASLARPYGDFQRSLDSSITILSACIAFVFDVPKLPSGAKPPRGIECEELDIHVEHIQKALTKFDQDCAVALEGANALEDLQGRDPDIMPREEVFLTSSFMLNVRQAGTQVESMILHVRELVRKRHERKGRRTIYLPHIKWFKWLTTGGDNDEAVPNAGRKSNRTGTIKSEEIKGAEEGSTRKEKKSDQSEDPEKAVSHREKEPWPNATHPKERIMPPTKSKKTTAPIHWSLRIRGKAADVVEWFQNSEDMLYAVKLSLAVFLVLWPAFVSTWNSWFSFARGLWAALQLIFVTEVSIGTSVNVFISRFIGTTVGCLWGWAAYEAKHGNRIVCAVMLCIAMFPFCYVQLGTPYVKVGNVTIVSMCVVALSTELNTVPGNGTENFLKRWIAFIIGGCVALVVELTLWPIRARTRMVESIISAISHTYDMQKCISFGIDDGINMDVLAPHYAEKLERASTRANASIGAAETFMPYCYTEPRIKGSFEALAVTYEEIIFVLHQIVDRMDNMSQLRKTYGSGPLEELNHRLYQYRRNVAGAITLTLFSVQSALDTKLPLPQFMPSARLAHLRMINRVREVVIEKIRKEEISDEEAARIARKRAVRRKYLSWNASAAAQAEIIEYLEELVALAKLLVGANEFRSGLLKRSNYQAYLHNHSQPLKESGSSEHLDEVRDTLESENTFNKAQYIRRKRAASRSSITSGREMPLGSRNLHGRKQERVLIRQSTNERS